MHTVYHTILYYTPNSILTIHRKEPERGKGQWAGDYTSLQLAWLTRFAWALIRVLWPLSASP